MKEELLNIAMQSLSDDDVKEIVKDKFKKMMEKAIEDAFRWGDADRGFSADATNELLLRIREEEI